MLDELTQEAPVETEVEAEQRVTPLELFFDLVFVFAITQATGFVSERPSWIRLVEGLAILAVLWFAWSGYAWLGNTANTDEGLVRVILLSAMAAMLIASLAVPHAFGSDGLIFGIAYFVVRALHIGCYAAVARARNDPTLAAAVSRLASTMLPAAALLVIGGALSGAPRAVCWAAALLVDYGGLVVRGVEGWRVEPGHFAERHSAVIIIALGESIVSLSVGAGGVRLGAGVIVGALFGIAIAAALWWAYFDVVSIVAERRLRRAPPRDQVLIARDSYTYLHLPMLAGIIVFAIGVKRTLVAGRRTPPARTCSRAVRRRGPLFAGTQRVQAAQHRLLQPPAARRRWPARGLGSRRHGDVCASRAGPRDGHRMRPHRL